MSPETRLTTLTIPCPPRPTSTPPQGPPTSPSSGHCLSAPTPCSAHLQILRPLVLPAHCLDPDLGHHPLPLGHLHPPGGPPASSLAPSFPFPPSSQSGSSKHSHTTAARPSKRAPGHLSQRKGRLRESDKSLWVEERSGGIHGRPLRGTPQMPLNGDRAPLHSRRSTVGSERNQLLAGAMAWMVSRETYSELQRRSQRPHL